MLEEFPRTVLFAAAGAFVGPVDGSGGLRKTGCNPIKLAGGLRAVASGEGNEPELGVGIDQIGTQFQDALQSLAGFGELALIILHVKFAKARRHSQRFQVFGNRALRPSLGIAAETGKGPAVGGASAGLGSFFQCELEFLFAAGPVPIIIDDDLGQQAVRVAGIRIEL